MKLWLWIHESVNNKQKYLKLMQIINKSNFRLFSNRKKNTPITNAVYTFQFIPSSQLNQSFQNVRIKTLL